MVARQAASSGHRPQDRVRVRVRVRVEHGRDTPLVHISNEDGGGWTTVAIDRPTREWSVAQGDTQRDAATAALSGPYE